MSRFLGPEDSPRRWTVIGCAVLVAIIGGAVTASRRSRVQPRDPMPVHGAMPAAGTSIQIELACNGGTLEACPVGAVLVFAVRGDDADGFLNALARPADGTAPIWYFSHEGQSPRAVSQGPVMPALSFGIPIGAEHRPGNYQVDVLMAESPLRRAELMNPPSRGVRARRVFQLTVTAP